MINDIDIECFGQKIGGINFVRSPRILNASRTGTGFELRIPVILKFMTVGSNEPQPMISNLQGEVWIKDGAGGRVKVGRLWYDSWETGGIHGSDSKSYESEREISLTWSGTSADLALVEQVRAGRPPAFDFYLHGEYCYLLPGFAEHMKVRTEPERVYASSAYVEVAYTRELWLQMLDRLGVATNVLVEIPLLGRSTDARWDGVWSALVVARDAFAQGGTTGWQSCVVRVRQALEQWRDIEGVDTGPNVVRQRSKRERLNNLRLALYESTHNMIHPQDEATRDDALLMLATLSALLAERKP